MQVASLFDNTTLSLRFLLSSEVHVLFYSYLQVKRSIFHSVAQAARAATMLSEKNESTCKRNATRVYGVKKRCKVKENRAGEINRKGN